MSRTKTKTERAARRAAKPWIPAPKRGWLSSPDRERERLVRIADAEIADAARRNGVIYRGMR